MSDVESNDAGETVQLLGRLGYLESRSAEGAVLAEAISEFQRDHGLEATGEANYETLTRLRDREQSAPEFLKRVSRRDQERIQKLSDQMDALVVEISHILAPYFHKEQLQAGVVGSVGRQFAISDFTLHASPARHVSFSFRSPVSGYGPNVECYCDPPGICVPCNDHPGCPGTLSAAVAFIAAR